MQFILPSIYALLFTILIGRMTYFDVQSLSRVKLILLFVLKLIAGIVAYLIYSNYYASSDFTSYFNDSQILIQHLSGHNSQLEMQTWNSHFDPLIFNGSRIMILLNAILQIFSFGNFYVHIVFFCFLSFFGLVGIYKSFNFYFSQKSIQLIIGIFFLPTVLFWSSTALKESVVIGIIGLIIYYTNFGLKRDLTLAKKSVVLFLFAILFLLKIYVACALIPVIIVNIIVSRTSVKMLLLKYVLIFGVLFTIGFLVKLIFPDYNISQIIANKQANAISEAKGGLFLENDKNFICVDYFEQFEILSPQNKNTFKIIPGSKFISWKQNNMADTTFVTNSTDTAIYKVVYAQAPAKSVIQLKKLKPLFVDILFYSPVALMNVLFRPTIYEISSWLHLAAVIENLWIVLVMIMAIAFYDKKLNVKKEVILFALVFALLLFILIGLTSPVIGSILRYRTIGMVFFVPLCLVLIDETKLKKFVLFPFVKR